MPESEFDPNDAIASWFGRLDPDQCQRLHEASLTILERTGVRLYHQEAIDLLSSAGAGVSEGNRVRIPAHLVERALSTTPKQVTLYDQHGEPALKLAGHKSYFGTGCDCLHIVDHRSWQRRPAVLQDVIEGTTLSDALENIDFVMSMFLPSDVPGEIADRYQMEVMLNYTTKPIVFVTYSFAGWRDAIEMAEMVAGGAGALRERPFVTCYANATTALRHGEDSLQKLLYAAERGLPALYIGGSSAGLTAPVTVAANLALRNAGSLVGLVIAQLKREGTPMIVTGAPSGGLDMRTMVLPYAEPEPHGGLQSMAHFYGLPMFSTAGASNAKLVDQQAAVEAAMTLVVDALTGGHLVHNVGYLESALSGSLAHLAICDEILSWVRTVSSKVEINDETLALDLIDEAGPDGGFLDSAHTLRHYRERWYPRLIERGNYEQWLARGGQTMAERAAVRVQEILETHQPQRLPGAVARRLRAVVEGATA